MSLFRTVTGADFARSIAWARRQPPNPITEALKKHSMSTATKPEMKLISPAKFFSSGRYIDQSTQLAAEGFKNSPNSIILPAEIEYNGIRLFSEVPNSAAKAEKINNALRA